MSKITAYINRLTGNQQEFARAYFLRQIRFSADMGADFGLSAAQVTAITNRIQALLSTVDTRFCQIHEDVQVTSDDLRFDGLCWKCEYDAEAMYA